MFVLQESTLQRCCEILMVSLGLMSVQIGAGGEGQPFAVEAREYLRTLINGQRVRVKLLGRDRYGRIIATVSLTSLWAFRRDVGEMILREGLATIYRGTDACYHGRYETYCSAERQAREARKGMWSQAEVVLPAEFKRRKRQNNVAGK